MTQTVTVILLRIDNSNDRSKHCLREAAFQPDANHHSAASESFPPSDTFANISLRYHMKMVENRSNIALTCVVDVQLVHNALISAAKHNDELLYHDRTVTVPRRGRNNLKIYNFSNANRQCSTYLGLGCGPVEFNIFFHFISLSYLGLVRAKSHRVTARWPLLCKIGIFTSIHLRADNSARLSIHTHFARLFYG